MIVILFNFSDDLKPVPKSERKLKNEPLIELVSEQALNKSCTSSETGAEQAVVPSINYINNTNISNDLNLDEQTQKVIAKNEAISKKENNELEENTSKEKKLRQKKKGFIEPDLSEVEIYFQEQNYPELEAQKFFNYFSSNGWLVGGKTEMKDWQAAARNWMLNTQKFNRYGESENRAKHLNATIGKDYSEPL